MKKEKLELKKLQVSKLKNPNFIFGGNNGGENDGGETATDKEVKKILYLVFLSKNKQDWILSNVYFSILFIYLTPIDMNRVFFLILISLFFACKTQKQKIDNSISNFKINKLTDEGLKKWHLGDYENDTIPGISIKKASDFLVKKKSKKIKIAVIDATIDVEHEDLAKSIWHNQYEEINNADDDGNGLVDDINGWNYIGHLKGNLPLYENYEVVRIVRFYSSLVEKFKNNSSKENQLTNYNLAKTKLENKRSSIQGVIAQGEPLIKRYYAGLDSIKNILNGQELSLPLLEEIKKNHSDLENEIDAVMLPLLYDMNISDLENDLDFRKRLLNIYYNPDYKERGEIEDNPNDLNDSIYGNSMVDGLKDEISHGSNVTGIIAANQDNNLGIEGILNDVEIIPIVVAVNGEAHDKDLARGIKYAVDKGASIINISINKEFSLHKQWVFNAIKYAASKDVLIVTAAGNDNTNLDEVKNFYPNDTDYIMPEISNNFLMVGGITYDIGKNLKYKSSNYGKETVDIMAPAKEIYTTASNNTYEFVDGTSFAAPIVTGVAGLIRSFYPSLSTKDVKLILMESGITYDGLVNIADSDAEKEELVPFSSLSKSGRIVNAYNALLMADRFSKKK